MGSPQAIPPLPAGYTLDQQPSAAVSAVPPLPPGYKLDSPTPSAPAPAPTTEAGYDSNPVIRGLQHMTDATVGTHTNQGVIEGATKGLPEMVEHPVESAKMLSDAAATAQQQPWNDAYAAWNDPDHPIEGKLRGIVHAAYGLIPFAGPMLNEAGKSFGRGDIASGIGTTAGVGTGLLLGKKSPGAVAEEGTAGEMGTVGAGMGKPGTPAAPGVIPRGSVAAAMSESQPARGVIAKRMNKVGPTEQFSLADRLQTAQQHGINLDVADATNSGAAKAVKGPVSRSIGGRGVFEGNQEKNVSALNDWADEFTGGLSQQSGEGAGARIQQALQADHQQLKNAASSEFKDLTKSVGQNTVPIKDNVAATAQEIKQDFGDYYDKFPEYRPAHAWKVVNNLANRDTASWDELHNLRSDVMDEYRNSPDLTKSRAEGWMQRLAGSIDESMTSAKAGLAPEQAEQFRHANELWEQMKSTYDNPQHPFYYASRTQQPSSVASTLGTKYPEIARAVNKTLGPDAGVFQRAMVDKLLGRNVDGAGYDFKGLPQRLKQVDPVYLQELLGPAKATELQKMARIGKTVVNNENPSGTGAIMVPQQELTVGNAPFIPYNWAAARAMTSPRVVNLIGRGSISKAMQR